MKIKQVKIPFTIEIPEDWELVSNRKIFVEHNVRGKTDLDLLSVSQTKGVIPQNEILEKKDTSNEDKSNYKEVMKEYIVYNKMRMWQGAVGISKYEGIVSPAYVVLKKRNDKVLPEFFHYQFRSSFYIKQSGIFSYGLCDDMNSLRYEDFKNMKSVLPPKDAQQKIVDSIIFNGNLVEQFINKRLKYIELLKEYKQSKINELVTKGINPNVKMKDSRIEWLGEIPEHWEVRRLKHITKLEYGSSLEETMRKGGDISVYGSNGIVGKHSIAITDLETIVIGRKGSYGKINWSNTSCFPIDTTFYIDKNCLRAKFSLKYLYYLLQQLELDKNSKDSAVPGLDRGEAYNKFCVFPPLKEQKIITNEIEKFEKYIEKAIEHTRKQIELIQQYRQSLIYELITGKRKP